MNILNLNLDDAEQFRKQVSEELNNKWPVNVSVLNQEQFQEVTLSLSVFTGSLEIIDWIKVIPFFDIIQGGHLKAFFETQPNLLSFAKNKFIFEELITEFMSSETDKTLAQIPNFIEDIRAVHPDLDLNAQKRYCNKESHKPFIGVVKENNYSIIQTALIFGKITTTQKLLKQGANFLGSPENTKNTFSLALSPSIFEFILQENHSFYYDSLRKYHGGVLSYAPILSHPNCTTSRPSIEKILGLNQKDIDLWEENTLKSREFFQFIRKNSKNQNEIHMNCASDFLLDAIQRRPELIETVIMPEHHKHAGVTLRELSKAYPVERVEAYIMKIETQKTIETHLQKSRIKQTTTRF